MDTNYPTEIHVTYRCKFCKLVRQASYPVRVETRKWHNKDTVTRYALKQDSLHPGEYNIGSGPTGRADFSTSCNCGKSMQGKEIIGTVKTSVKCDIKCTGAIGHVCECSCGGANHGLAHRTI